MNKIIEVKNLVKKYGALIALKEISFEVESGEIFVVVGPNGAGKTSLLEAIEGLRPYEGGQIRILGQKMLNDIVKNNIGVQLEDSQFDGKMKVSEIFELYGCFYQKSLELNGLLVLLGLDDKAGQYYEQLSKGWRQKVAIGVTMIHDPQILFFDEISSGLDPIARREIWQLLAKIKKQGKTIILTSHYMEEAEYLADQLLVIGHGAVLAQDKPANLIAKYCGGSERKNLEEVYLSLLGGV